MSVTTLALARPALRSPALAGHAWGLVATLLWGGYLAFARAGVQGGLAPLDLAVLRYGVAALLVLPLLPRLGLRGLGWRRAGVLALLAGPPFILLGAAGFLFAPLAHGAVVQPAAVTILTMLLAMLVLGERVAARRWLGVAVVLAGLVLVSGAGAAAAGAWRGDLLFVAAGLLWALFTVAVRAWRIDPLHATVAVAVLGGAAIVPVWLLVGDPAAMLAIDPRTLLVQAVMQGALAGLLAVFAFSRAAALLGPGRAAIFPAMVPAVAVLWGIPVAGEWPEPVQWLGLATVLAGLPLAMGLVRARMAGPTT